MRNIDIIVMGKTGAGKSTLINAVLEEDLAPTGIGQPVTRKNKVYTKKMMLPVGAQRNGQYGLVGCQLNMYDTVGLEIDSSITNRTLEEIKRHIQKTKSNMSSGDFHLVWFCVSYHSSRFEKYELELIKKLSIDYEIPFVIVLTQCISNTAWELENEMSRTIPEVPRKRILAKEYKTRGGTIPAYGVLELIRTSLNDYRPLKIDILQKKLNALDGQHKGKIAQIESKGENIIKKQVASAAKIGGVPGVCIPAVHKICIKMIAELNDLAGFQSGREFAGKIFRNVIVGALLTPLMVIPFLSGSVASSYVQKTGDSYLKAMLAVIDQSSDGELQNEALVIKRLEQELKTLKNRR